MELMGKEALVTGASRGIGRAIACAFAAEGADVTCVGRNSAQLDQVGELIRSTGQQASLRVGDVNDADFMKRVVEEMPRVDIVVNNAGINILEGITELQHESVDAVIQTNVTSLIWVTHLAVQRMIADHTQGLIIMMSSMLGHVGGPGRAVYTASKHAVEGFSRAIAPELGPYGIRTVAIAPGYINTDMMATRLADPEFRRAAEARIPLGRVGEAHEVAELAVFLASAKASFINGSSVVLDGGTISS
jgi:NAD(P)-dependent dehydrogenase (short-subunit alcohol dehydrogenase family)